MARYLVTGGAGFTGSHLVELLQANGAEVRVLDDLSTGKLCNLPKAVEVIVGDVADRCRVASVAKGCDGIFHLAAVGSVQRSTEDWVGAHRTNQTGTVAVLDVARAFGRIPVVYASSAAIYGDNPSLPLSEAEAPRPVTAYGVDKYGSELHARLAWPMHGLPTAGLRFFNVFGPRQEANSRYSSVISTFAQRLELGQALMLHGDGQQTRDFIFVVDVVRHLTAAMALLQREPDSIICNVCTGSAVSIETLARMMAEAAGLEARIEFGPARAGDIRHSCGDPRFARMRLGVAAEVNLLDGLATTIRSLFSKMK